MGPMQRKWKAPKRYAAAVSVKKTVGSQTPQWPKQAVKPQPNQNAPNHQAEMPKPQGKKAPTTSSDRSAQSVNIGTDDEGKNTQPSIGPMPKTSGGSTKPLTPQGGEKDDQPQDERPIELVAESSYAMKAASPPQPKPVALKRDHPVLVNVRHRFAALSERKNIAVF